MSQVKQPQLLEIYKKMYRSRSFEQGLIKAHENGIVKTPVYLSTGQEATAATISTVIKRCNIFCQHRNHATYLSFGGDAKKLRDELLFKETGCMGGRGGSMSLQFENKDVHMFAHHGFIGENIPLAVGAALGDRSRTSIVFAGDAAYEEDYAFPAIGFAATHNLPVLFIVEDNDLAILTPKSVRRNWSIQKIAEAFGVFALDISDDPWKILRCFDSQMPCEVPPEKRRNLRLLNIHTHRHRWHVGIGIDAPPKEDRMVMFREELCNLGFRGKIMKIEVQVKKEMEKLWGEI